MYKYICRNIAIIYLCVLLTIGILSSISTVRASSTDQVGYDCRFGLVSIGDSSVDLMTRCGKPDDIAMRIAPYGTGLVQVWVYLNRHMARDDTIAYISINTLDKISRIKVIR